MSVLFVYFVCFVLFFYLFVNVVVNREVNACGIKARAITLRTIYMYCLYFECACACFMHTQMNACVSIRSQFELLFIYFCFCFVFVFCFFFFVERGCFLNKCLWVYSFTIWIIIYLFVFFFFFFFFFLQAEVRQNWNKQTPAQSQNLGGPQATNGHFAVSARSALQFIVFVLGAGWVSCIVSAPSAISWTPRSMFVLFTWI